MKKIIVISSVIIVLGITLFFYILKENFQLNTQKENPFENQQKDFALDSFVIQGKIIFENNCNVCHKIYKKADPPILRSSIKNYNGISFEKFVKNEERKRINDFKGVECKSFPELNSDKIQKLYIFLKYTIN